MQATPTHAPQCTPVVGNTLLHAFAELVSDQTTPSTGSLATEQLKRVLNLSVALWGDLAGDPGMCVCVCVCVCGWVGGGGDHERYTVFSKSCECVLFVCLP